LRDPASHDERSLRIGEAIVNVKKNYGARIGGRPAARLRDARCLPFSEATRVFHSLRSSTAELHLKRVKRDAAPSRLTLRRSLRRFWVDEVIYLRSNDGNFVIESVPP
jgi:hypothetical protein